MNNFNNFGARPQAGLGYRPQGNNLGVARGRNLEGVPNNMPEIFQPQEMGRPIHNPTIVPNLGGGVPQGYAGDVRPRISYRRQGGNPVIPASFQNVPPQQQVVPIHNVPQVVPNGPVGGYPQEQVGGYYPTPVGYNQGYTPLAVTGYPQEGAPIRYQRRVRADLVGYNQQQVAPQQQVVPQWAVNTPPQPEAPSDRGFYDDLIEKYKNTSRKKNKKRRPKVSARRYRDEDYDEDEYELDRPRRRRYEEEDDEYELDRPRRRRYEDEDDEHELDRPRRRRRRRDDEGGYEAGRPRRRRRRRDDEDGYEADRPLRREEKDELVDDVKSNGVSAFASNYDKNSEAQTDEAEDFDDIVSMFRDQESKKSSGGGIFGIFKRNKKEKSPKNRKEEVLFEGGDDAEDY